MDAYNPPDPETQPEAVAPAEPAETESSQVAGSEVTHVVEAGSVPPPGSKTYQENPQYEGHLGTPGQPEVETVDDPTPTPEEAQA